ncbi:hypothetical protein K491DRAFT_762661 [Lophiostoma macrostomum CBS 122681]|uniref:SRR1-like domain-containing protein n=1 Tax=Lophiostoma macrostomum CBS 122681 TaxID=1314788 RepID=A0A6A6SR46_9PLEO|nr:hypothetical protein K491DRAFT_762661 [Lophiostoma macrostomum CBS 122681]
MDRNPVDAKPAEVDLRLMYRQDIAEIRKDMEQSKELWQTTDSQNEIVEKLAKHLKRSDVSRIDKIVCLALGTIRRDSSHPDPRIQHHLASGLARALGLPVCAQDPAYSEMIDEIILEQLDPPISVIHDPQGVLAIDESTLVICLFSNAPLLEVIADLLPQGPTAMIINEAGLRRENPLSIDSWNTPRVMDLIEKYEVHGIGEICDFSEDLIKVINRSSSGFSWLPRVDVYVRKAS